MLDAFSGCNCRYLFDFFVPLSFVGFVFVQLLLCAFHFKRLSLLISNARTNTPGDYELGIKTMQQQRKFTYLSKLSIICWVNFWNVQLILPAGKPLKCVFVWMFFFFWKTKTTTMIITIIIEIFFVIFDNKKKKTKLYTIPNEMHSNEMDKIFFIWMTKD